MIAVVSNEQMRELDNKAISEFDIPSAVLMENAGRNSAEFILEQCNELLIDTAVIFAGKGNNGGDGFVIARYLDKNGIDVIVYLAAKKKELTGDAEINFGICLKQDIEVIEIQNTHDIQVPSENFLIVDALLGTGIKGKLKGFYTELINWINDQDCPICAIDMPSGANGNSCAVAGPVIYADWTCTMGLPKLGQLFYPLRTFVGDLNVIDIGFPTQLEMSEDLKVFAVDEDDIILDQPDSNINKHKAGRVFILGGSPGMTGAITLSAKGASVAGAGLVVAGVAEALNPILEIKLTEQMTLPLADTNGMINEKALLKIEEKIEWCDAFLIGPGFGRAEQSSFVINKSIEKALELNKKIVIDADALFYLAADPNLLSKLKSNCVITPHHGEFGRFEHILSEKLKEQPWQVLSDFIEHTDCTVNLKGAPSIVGQKENGVFINTTGNPGLAKGGSGDLLAGLIAGLAATGMAVIDASIYANYIHGQAADNAAEKWSITSFSMEDLIEEIKLVYKELY